ncbi:MAG: transporter substrate-binding domain-containing protein [Sphingobacteriia bacterium]|nr:transporter substrate-binding domain-containing protein [Sphingobacteriia bacterium]
MHAKFLRNSTLFFVIAVLAVTGCSKNDNDDPDYSGELKSIIGLTEHYPPFNYEHEGGISGVSVDIYNGLAEKMGLNPDEITIEMDDWETFYQRALDEPGTMLFSTIRIPERENLFKWVGPVAPQKEVIITLASAQIEINNASELAAHKIGVIQEYSSIDELLELGVPSAMLTEVNSIAELYAVLEDGTVDCIAFSEVGHGLFVASSEYEPDYFEVVFTVQVRQLYYAFNINFSDELINYVQAAFEQFRLDKTEDGSSIYEKILNKYQIIQHDEDNITEQMVTELVHLTATHLGENAPSAILNINAGKAPYLDVDNPALYAFAYDTAINMVAHATNPLLVGKNFRGKTDAAGKPFRDEIVARALTNGCGWEDYVYTKPDQSGLYLKTTYYKLATGSDGRLYIVCAGRYK